MYSAAPRLCRNKKKDFFCGRVQEATHIVSVQSPVALSNTSRIKRNCDCKSWRMTHGMNANGGTEEVQELVLNPATNLSFVKLVM